MKLATNVVAKFTKDELKKRQKIYQASKNQIKAVQDQFGVNYEDLNFQAVEPV